MGVDLYLNRKRDDKEIGYWRNDFTIEKMFIDGCNNRNFHTADCTDLLVDKDFLIKIKEWSENLTKVCDKALDSIENGDDIYFLKC